MIRAGFNMNTIQMLQCMIMLLAIDIHLYQAFYVSNLSVPRFINASHKAKLFCSYEIGNRTLNSVKWYKDGQEFFRYSPLTPPTTNWFPVKGVTIADGSSHCNQFICNVELEKLNAHSTGSYRCEVSGDAPEFKLIDKTANMTVGVFPKYDPVISGLQPFYKYGDFIRLNCSSEWTNPMASLTWYINNKTAPLTTVKPQINEIRQESTSGKGFTLYASTRQLRIHINDPHYLTRNDILLVKCVSEIMGMATIRRQSQVIVNILALKDATTHKQRLMGTTITSITSTTNGSCDPITASSYHHTLLLAFIFIIIITTKSTMATALQQTAIVLRRISILDNSSPYLALIYLTNTVIIILLWSTYHNNRSLWNMWNMWNLLIYS